ncbi:hypothetical protein D9M71_700610 [compost metagenome]
MQAEDLGDLLQVAALSWQQRLDLLPDFGLQAIGDAVGFQVEAHDGVERGVMLGTGALQVLRGHLDGVVILLEQRRAAEIALIDSQAGLGLVAEQYGPWAERGTE